MISSYEVDRIIISKYEGRTDWQDKNPTTTIEVKGYVEYKTRLIRDIKGEEVVSSIMIRIDKRKLDKKLNRALNHEDRIYKINGEILDRAIMKLNPVKDITYSHYEVYLA